MAFTDDEIAAHVTLIENAFWSRPDGFSIRWDGTILPTETGLYEFVIRTRNGVTLWINEHQHGEEAGKKVIDGWVRLSTASLFSSDSWERGALRPRAWCGRCGRRGTRGCGCPRAGHRPCP